MSKLNDTPYGTSWLRWLWPLILCSLLMLVDQLGGISVIVICGLLLIYLPRTFLSVKFKGFRKERLIRAGLYGATAVTCIALAGYNAVVARDRAEKLVSAIEAYHQHTGTYPTELRLLVPTYIEEIPTRARVTYDEYGFRYRYFDGKPRLDYVHAPPFGRRDYDFSTKKWISID